MIVDQQLMINSNQNKSTLKLETLLDKPFTKLLIEFKIEKMLELDTLITTKIKLNYKT